jgi:hypothetical protein
MMNEAIVYSVCDKRSKVIYERPRNPSRTSRYTLQANDLFWRMYFTGKWKAAWARLRGQSRDLKLLIEADKSRVWQVHILERKAIRIADIHGSEGRVAEYDCDFYPRHRRDKQRWVGVCVGMMKDRTQFAPVEMVQLANTYYVRDGHHRISVGKALGHLFIDANVTVWEIKKAD